MPYTNPFYDPSRPHHTPTGFRNLEPNTRVSGDLKRWRRERREAGLPKAPEKGYEDFVTRWWQPADFATAGDAAWWLGHATVLVRRGGLHVVTDPVLSRRASPLSFAGPERRTPTPATVADLPRIDVVMLSHNHYDHLDGPTVRALVKRFPDVAFVVPLGLGRWFAQAGIGNVRELDWWESTTVAGATFTLVPARHWSARTPWDTNRTLWGGWVMEHEGFRFWFAGDTGYSEKLAEIASRLGTIDLAAIPIGAYAPRWFMGGQHVDPAQAVRLHRELGCVRSMAIHWGVFELADESLDEPPELLAEALLAEGIGQDDFRALRIGERLALRETDR
ncbi:L-ascorbate metabolism protein UlaG (beta-lactamase superfamily) [Luteibacter rhizovicinus]|uniref:L-ascorbate metabolism protein UlaG (Beta-lactamase superfamily) n=1 Tax=Luteibacter rhizovicinus TaxID=242606 RepID=A0A4R3YY13_9GAMM|nr:MBL fold metallo-hydrolase [Luteibacter rhizovicinus]TCV97476.1 L-ascorbate metabolism protein UlaG (beta-lactamase superfamily) [Luteibacter rhizovicinus]